MARIPNPTEVHIGWRLKIARQEAGISQTVAGERLDVSFQQIQKYERGFDRISASNLFKLAHLYGRPVGWFFEGLTEADEVRRAA